MGKFHQDLTYKELELGEVPCPVCMEVDYYVALLLESTHYEAGYHGYNVIDEGDILGLLGLKCQKCDFELIKRTPREALWYEGQ